MIQKKQFFFNMSAAEYRKMMGMPAENIEVKKSSSGNKFHAKKTEVGGVVYDSKREAKHAQQLQALADSGAIQNLQRQVRFTLQDAYINNKGEKIRKIEYVADFVYEENGKKIVEDVKGSKNTLTEVFKLKKKLFEYKYPDYFFVVVY